jgi:hypothetical protein
MSESEPTWILLVRDVTAAASVAGQPRTMASIVLDADTGLIRGASVAATAQEACTQAAEAALTQPAGPLPPHVPVTVVYPDGEFAADALAALGEVLPSTGATALLAAPAIPEAEDIFDSLVGHLAGRPQPTDAPGPSEWTDLYELAAAYCRAEPWRRWSDADLLDLVVTLDDEPTRYVAVVLGQEGVQHGLAIYPGDDLPAGLRDWQPGETPPLPEGSATLWLDPPSELPHEYVARASRYGWPSDLPLAPIPVSAGPSGLGDLAREPARHLTLALAAVVGLDDRMASGTVTFSDESVGRFDITATDD